MPTKNHNHHPARRIFLKQAGTASLLASLGIYKPCTAKTNTKEESSSHTFTPYQKANLKAAQLLLFPADGDGPSAMDINAPSYLDQALNDPKNKEDGDREFIIKGIGWLEELSQQKYNQDFVKVTPKQQHNLIQHLSESKKGDNWISLLVYYLLEALLLDPVYDGNSHEVGWRWLEHQSGFPRPTIDKNYLHYMS